METVIEHLPTAAALVMGVLACVVLAERFAGVTPGRDIETERVEVRAATVDAALDRIEELGMSAYPMTPEEVAGHERGYNAIYLNKALAATSPLLPTTVVRVPVDRRLTAVVRIPNPNYDAG